MFEWLDERIENLKGQGISPERAMRFHQDLIDQLNNLPQDLQNEIDYLDTKYKELKQSVERGRLDSPISWTPPIVQDYNPLDKNATVRIKTKGGDVFISYDELSDIVEIFSSPEHQLWVAPIYNTTLSLRITKED